MEVYNSDELLQKIAKLENDLITGKVYNGHAELNELQDLTYKYLKATRPLPEPYIPSIEERILNNRYKKHNYGIIQ